MYTFSNLVLLDMILLLLPYLYLHSSAYFFPNIMSNYPLSRWDRIPLHGALMRLRFGSSAVDLIADHSHGTVMKEYLNSFVMMTRPGVTHRAMT